MKIIALILCIAIMFLFSLPVFASSQIVSGETPSGDTAPVPYGSDYFTTIVTVLCLSALSLVALLIASAYMKKNK